MRADHAAVGVCLWLTAYGAPASGQVSAGEAAQPHADAQAALDYEAGVKAAEQGDTARAYTLLVKAWSLKRHFQVAANLGLTELDLGKHRDAAEHLAYFLREATSVSAE